MQIAPSLAASISSAPPPRSPAANGGGVPGSTAPAGAAGDGSTDAARDPVRGTAASAGTAGGLNADQQRQLTALQSRDREVRAHEAAHQAAGGSLVGGASFSYEQGPDGRSYAVGGEVSVDTSPVQGDPSATIAKMARVRAAALAPAEPSGQDLAVAAAAAQQAASAEQELAQLQTERERSDRPDASAHKPSAAATDNGGSGAAPAAGGSDPSAVAPARRGAIAAYARSSAIGGGTNPSIDISA